MEKQAILLAAYGGAGVNATRTLGLFEERIRESCPGVPVRWAFTSLFMRNRMTASGKKNDSVKKALCRLGFENFTKIAVQSLHIVPGVEFHALLDEIKAAKESGAPQAVDVGGPLLHAEADIEMASEALLAAQPPGRALEDAVLWVGHGSGHEDCTAYVRLAQRVAQKDPRVFVGTLSGEAALEGMREALLASGARKVWLLPLLAVLGKHAERDLAGDGPESWKSRLTVAGLECEAYLRGIIECRSFVDIWVGHLLEAAPWLAANKM